LAFPISEGPPTPLHPYCEILATVRASKRDRKWRIDTDDDKEYFCV
jgi:hypothetical protein